MITFSWSLSEFMMNVVKSTTLSTKQEKPEKVDIEAPICWPTLELSTHHRQDTVRTKWKRNRLLPGGCAGSREKTPWKEAKFWKSFVGLTGTWNSEPLIPTKCLRLRLLPSATALGSCWRSVLGISIKTVPKSKRQQKVASMQAWTREMFQAAHTHVAKGIKTLQKIHGFRNPWHQKWQLILGGFHA